MALAKQVGQWSKDRSTRVGAVIVKNRDVIATGYNGFPRGIDDEDDERHERPEKYLWTEHAERNAVYAAAKMGHPLDGATIYVTVAEGRKLFCCADCARAIIQSGITRVVADTADFLDPKWGPDMNRAARMLIEAGVDVQLQGDR